MTAWLDEPPTAAPTEAPEPSPAPAKPTTIHPDSATWVTEWLYVYSPKPTHWCLDWAQHHPAAAARIHALWEAWEVAQADGPPAMSSWWIYHHDTHMGVLTSARGPFAACQSGHRPTPVWKDDHAPH